MACITIARYLCATFHFALRNLIPHIVTLLTLCIALNATAQDSLGVKQWNHADSIYNYQNKSLDSLQQNFHHRTDSLQQACSDQVKNLQGNIGKLNHKKDSLSKLNLPTGAVTHEIDSLQEAQARKVSELNSQIEKVKKETLAKASSLNLPPQAQDEINKFSKSIHGYSPPALQLPGVNLPNLNIPGLSLPSGANLPNANMPSLPQSNSTLPSLPQVDGVSKEINSVTKEISSVTKEVNSVGKEINSVSKEVKSVSNEVNAAGKEIEQAKSLEKNADTKSIEKEAEKMAGQNQEVKSVLKEQAATKDLQKQFDQVKDVKNVDSLAMAQLKPAVNHFTGKEQELKAAMDKVSKLKQKYSSVTSLSELPKRRPNPLKGKPWIERIIPGLNYFVQNKHYTLVDFNPYVGWRFTPKFSATLGWNQRIGIKDWSFQTRQYDHLFGVRATANYRWVRGINFKVAPEVMNAYIPTNGAHDVKHQATVWGLYAGIRKDYPIYKSLKGYSEVMYNFTQKTFRNVYGDPVSFRFGLELQLKKKTK